MNTRDSRLSLIWGIIALLILSSIATSRQVSASLNPSFLFSHNQTDPLCEAIACLGSGTATNVQWSPNGELLEISGTFGVDIYTNTFEEVASFAADETIAWSPDSQLLAAGVQIWDTATQQVFMTLETGDEYPPVLLDWNTKGNLLLGIGALGNRTIWDAYSGQMVSYVEDNNLTYAVWSHDGRFIAQNNRRESSVQIRDTVSDELVREWQISSGVNIIAWSPDGQYIATIGEVFIGLEGQVLDHGVVEVWYVETTTLIDTFEIDAARVRAIDWHPNSSELGIIDQNGSLYIWDFDGQQQLFTVDETLPFLRINYSNLLDWNFDGSTLATTTTGSSVKIWDSETYELVRVIDKYSFFTHASWSYDGKYIATGYGAENTLIWNTDTWEPIFGFQETLFPLTWNTTANQIAFGVSEGNIQIWDADMQEAILQLSQITQSITALSWSPDGMMLAIGTDNSIVVWNLSTFEVLELFNDQGYIRDVSWSPDGNQLGVTNNDYQTRVWSIETESVIWEGQPYRSLQWSPDGSKLILSGRDTVQVLDAETFEIVHEIDIENATYPLFAWSSDGELAAIENMNVVEIYDSQTWDLVNTFDEYNQVYSIDWNPVNNLLAITGGDGIIRVLEQ